MQNFIRKLLFRLKISLSYFLVKLSFLQNLLSQSMRAKLPLDWNNKMLWMTFKSGGDRIYAGKLIYSKTEVGETIYVK